MSESDVSSSKSYLSHAKKVDEFETYATVKALHYLCTNPPEMSDSNFSKIQEILLDYSNTVTDNKLQAFIKTKIKKEMFENSGQELSEDSQHVLLELLVLLVVGKSEKLPLTTRLVFNFVRLIKQKKQFLESCFTSDAGASDLMDCILLQVKGLKVDESDIKVQQCNSEDERHDMLVEWLSGMFEVREDSQYKEAFKSLAIAYLSAHGYNEKIVADCVQRQKEFRKDERRNRAPILESLTRLLELKRF